MYSYYLYLRLRLKRAYRYHIGFYRVNYDEKNWKRLLIQLITRPRSIHVLNRAQIVDDACHLSKAGVVPYEYYISLLEYLLMEDHVVPWNSAVNGLSSTMDGLRRYPAEHRKFQVSRTQLKKKNIDYTTYACTNRARWVSWLVGWVQRDRCSPIYVYNIRTRSLFYIE